MARDNAPIGHTCGSIDDIIDNLNNAIDEAKYIINNPEEDSTEEANIIISTINDVINSMESIRSDNTELRQWGNDEYDRAEDAERELEYLKDSMESLQDENSELRSTVEELEGELRNAAHIMA